jgi:chromate transporter
VGETGATRQSLRPWCRPLVSGACRARHGCENARTSAPLGYNGAVTPAREVAAVMLKLGTIAFGGPAAHVALLRDEAVVRRQWVDDREFLELLGAVSVLPGPSSTQLAIALGRRRAGWRGLAAAGLFIVPAVLIVLALAWAYTRYGTTSGGAGILYGVEPVVVAIIVLALRDLARTAFRRRWLVVLALGAMVAYAVGINVLVPLLAAGLVAAFDERGARLAFLATGPVALVSDREPGVAAVLAEFLKLGTVVFGSGYVLVAFLRADLVEHLHWLTEQQVLDAVSIGQVTPGPVFTTATFIGYQLGGLPTALAATVGIFAPSFVLVALLERCIGAIRRSPALSRGLEGVSAAALGLMAAVTVDIAHTAIDDVLTIALALGALLAMARFRVNPIVVLAVGAAIGVVHELL